MTRPSGSDGGEIVARSVWERAPVQYGAALGTTALATALRLALDPWLGSSVPFMFFVPALVILAWYCRLGPLLVASGAGYLAGDYLIVEPRGSLLSTAPAGLLREMAYLLAVGSAVFVASRSREAGRRATADAAATRAVAEALRESEERLRAVYDATSDGLCMHEDGMLIEMNGALLRMLGCAREEVIGKRVLERFISADTIDRVRERIARGSEEPYEAVLQRPDGTRVPVEIRARQIEHKGRRVRVASARDITLRKRAQEALAESEARYRACFELASVGMARVDPWSGRFLEVNRRLCEITGYEAHELLGMTHRELNHPADADKGRESLERLVRGQTREHRVEKRYVRKDGSVAHVQISAGAVHDGQGRVRYLVAALADVTERARAEEELAASRRRVDSALIASEVATYEWDIAADRLYGDRNLQRLFGMPLDEQGAGSLAEFTSLIHPEDRGRVIALVRRTVETGADFEAEYRIVSGGAERWVISRGKLERDAEGRPARFPGVLLDITARKRAEEALRESEERYSGIFRQAAVGIIQGTPDGYYSAVNGAFCAMLGYTAEELMSRPAIEFTHPDDRAASEAQIGRVLRGEADGFAHEKRFLRKDGGVVWTDTRVSVVRDEEGRVRYSVGVVQDVTARREAERALNESEAKLRLVTDAAPALISYVDRGLIYRACNRAYEEWFGVSREKVIGSHVRDVLGDEAFEAIRPHMEAALEGRTQEFETYAPYARGGGRHIQVSYIPHEGPDGAVAGLFVLVNDVSERKRFEAELARYRSGLEELVQQRTAELERTHQQLRLSERMASLGTLSLGLGHDMGNLLLPIRARLDVLGAREDLPQDIRENLDPIRTCTEYLQNLSRGLRLFALDPEDEGAAANTTDMGAWAREALPFLKNAAGRTIAFEHEVPADLPAPAIAPHRLTQAVLNLVSNARDAIGREGPGRILVRARRTRDGDVAISVSDDGPGMTDEVRARCMEPFFTTKTRAVSTGLGLALVRGIVERAGGGVHIDSAPGEGTTITLVLPAAAEPEDQEDRVESVAAVTIPDGRVGSLVTGLLRVMGFEPRPCDGTPDDGAELWVVDPTPERLAEAQRFVTSRQGRVVVAVGEAGDEWEGPRIARVSPSEGLGPIRSAIIRALDDDREPSVGSGAARAG